MISDIRVVSIFNFRLDFGGVIFCVVLLFGAAVVQHKISVVSAPKATVEIFCYKTLRALEIILILAL